MKGEGRSVQFAVLGDSNASYFVSQLTMPIFRDPSAARAAWRELDPKAAKHDTIVFDAQGQVVSYRRASSGLSTWRDEVAATVRALPP